MTLFARPDTYITEGLITEREHPTHPHIKIYNYTPKCQHEKKWDTVTMMCRGLIVDTQLGRIIARPFPKFFNYGEREEEIPDEIPVVTEKLDGSLGILYWIDDIPAIATRGSFTSEQAIWATNWFRDHVTLLDVFDRNHTYLFEIIYPENRIVVDYDDYEGLILLAVLSTEIGSQYHRAAFVHHQLVFAGEYLNHSLSELQNMEKNNAEGFVVFYPSTGLRLKIKFVDYMRLHRLLTGVSPKRIWEMLRDNEDMEELVNKVPEYFRDWVNTIRAQIEDEYHEIERQALADYGALGELVTTMTRKEIAELIKQHTYPYLCFSILDGKDYRKSIWRLAGHHRLVKLPSEKVYKEEV